MIETAIRDLLLADSAVADLVGTRISPAPAPDETPSPFLTYQLISTPRDYTLDGPSGYVEPRVQLNCWSERDRGGGYGQVKQLANAVRLALNGFTGTSGAVPIQNIELADESDDWDDQAKAWGVRLDFIITTNEEL